MQSLHHKDSYSHSPIRLPTAQCALEPVVGMLEVSGTCGHLRIEWIVNHNEVEVESCYGAIDACRISQATSSRPVHEFGILIFPKFDFREELLILLAQHDIPLLTGQLLRQ